jgi:hypothetical protein
MTAMVVLRIHQGARARLWRGVAPPVTLWGGEATAADDGG